MKTDIECLPCFVRQSLQVARISGCTVELQLQVVKKISAIVANLDMHLSPPDNAGRIYKAIAEITGNSDPYQTLKVMSNEEALMRIEKLRREAGNEAFQLKDALRLAIAGNCIDYGAFANVDITSALDKSFCVPFAIDHSHHLANRIASLGVGSVVLYLTDNSGEIVYDSILIEHLFRQGFKITIAVKGGPIINDALLEDALTAGLDRFGRIISNGSTCPGSVLNQCSDEFRRIFVSADMVISKGQGNFESLSEVDREIFFLLMLKCPVAGRHMAELTGVDPADLPGTGEMTVYCSTRRSIP